MLESERPARPFIWLWIQSHVQLLTSVQKGPKSFKSSPAWRTTAGVTYTRRGGDSRRVFETDWSKREDFQLLIVSDPCSTETTEDGLGNSTMECRVSSACSPQRLCPPRGSLWVRWSVDFFKLPTKDSIVETSRSMNVISLYFEIDMSVHIFHRRLSTNSDLTVRLEIWEQHVRILPAAPISECSRCHFLTTSLLRQCFKFLQCFRPDILKHLLVFIHAVHIDHQLSCAACLFECVILMRTSPRLCGFA